MIRREITAESVREQGIPCGDGTVTLTASVPYSEDVGYQIQCALTLPDGTVVTGHGEDYLRVQWIIWINLLTAGERDALHARLDALDDDARYAD